MSVPSKFVRKIVKVGDLVEAKYNPAGRTSSERCKELEDSMELVGMLHPITINKDNQIIDGHRRLATAKRLKWKEVECNVIDAVAEEVYASVNVTQRRMSGNDALGVWLKCPEAVPHRMHRAFKKVVDVIGREKTIRIYNKGCSIRVYHTAVAISRYCDNCTDEMVASIVDWLLECAVIGQVMKALEGGVDPKKLMKAIRNRRPVVLKLDVA